jgi:nitrous oxide reductase accessory protein NosL
MKKVLLVVSIVLGLLTSSFAMEQKKAKMKNFRAVPADKAQIVQKGEGKNFCPICGMTLPMFYKTNHAAKHDGHDKQYCSIQCMAEDKEINGAKLTDFKAVDNESLKLKNSKDMFFVVGSKKPGTMSVVSKYGFATKEKAQEFQSKFGGKVLSFDETYELVKARLKDDIAATKKRQAKAAKMGEKIYNKMCTKTEKRFTQPAVAKTFIVQNKLCGNLKGKKLQQVALFLSGKKMKMAMNYGAGKCGGGKCSSSKCGK